VFVDGNNVRGGGAQRLSRDEVCQSVRLLSNYHRELSSKTNSNKISNKCIPYYSLKFVIYFDGGNEGEKDSNLINSKFNIFTNSSNNHANTGAAADKKNKNCVNSNDTHGQHSKNNNKEDSVFVRYCHKQIADDVIISDIINYIEKEKEETQTNPPPPPPIASPSATQESEFQFHNHHEKANKEQRDGGGGGDEKGDQCCICVVTSDRGLMLRCLDLNTLIMKCGPFLRMSKISQKETTGNSCVQ